MTKKDNNWLWVAALGIGGYLWYKNSQVSAAATAAATTTPGASTGILNVNPTTTINTNTPATALAASNAPNLLSENITGLVPAVVSNSVHVIQSGQTLAVNSNGSPVIANGVPMVFPSNLNPGNMKPSYLTLLSGADENEDL